MTPEEESQWVAEHPDMGMFADRQGTPINLFEWGRLRNDVGYCVVEQTDVFDHWVSTVWVGLKGGLMRDNIFETMVFDAAREGIAQVRYTTEDDARRGHELTCDLLHARLVADHRLN